PVGRPGPHPRAGQPGRHPAAPGPGRLLPGRGLGVRGAAADRRRLGVDRERLHRIPGVRRLPVPGVLRGVLRPGVQGAARRLLGGGPGGVPRHVPKRGLPDPPADLRRLRVRPGRRARRGALMCRHLAHLGRPRLLRELVLDPPHSLVKQSYLPKRQKSGHVNADGFGIGWYADGDPIPARYRRDTPIWADQSLPELARVVGSSAVVAAVRCASAGMAQGEVACAPFRHGQYLFSLNGAVYRWRELAAGLAAEDLLRLDAPVDALLIWLLAVRRLE